MDNHLVITIYIGTVYPLRKQFFRNLLRQYNNISISILFSICLPFKYFLTSLYTLYSLLAYFCSHFHRSLQTFTVHYIRLQARISNTQSEPHYPLLHVKLFNTPNEDTNSEVPEGELCGFAGYFERSRECCAALWET
jgi:hypothetical protein